MNKKQAIEIASEYINKRNSTQLVSIGFKEILDKEPIEFKDYWCFKSLAEDLKPMKGDWIKLNGVYPFCLISKKTKEISLINWKEYDELIKE